MTRTRNLIAASALALAVALTACQPAPPIESCDPLPGMPCTPEHP